MATKTKAKTVDERLDDLAEQIQETLDQAHDEGNDNAEALLRQFRQTLRVHRETPAEPYSGSIGPAERKALYELSQKG